MLSNYTAKAKYFLAVKGNGSVTFTTAGWEGVRFDFRNILILGIGEISILLGAPLVREDANRNNGKQTHYTAFGKSSLYIVYVSCRFSEAVFLR